MVSPNSTSAPLVSVRGAALAFGLACLLCWPMLTGQIFTFADTASYIRGGEIIWSMARELAFGGDAPANTGAGSGAGAPPGARLADAEGEPYFVRSFAYSLFSYATTHLVGPAALAIGQAWITVFTLFALVGREAASRPGILVAGGLFLLTLTTLPWFSVYLMPDIFAAGVLLYGAVLIRPFDGMSGAQRIAIGALATFAIVAHYGHPPVAAALFALVLLWRLVRRRLTVAVTLGALLPVILSPVANLTASSVALETPSAAPLRLPILLARSIGDGPARWYLDAACPEADLAFCEAFGDQTPGSIGEFLWDDEGINSISPELMQRIREEEFEILFHAFRAYPWAQSVSLMRNAARQTVQVGTGHIAVTAGFAPNWDTLPAPDAVAARRLLSIYDDLTVWATWAAAAGLAAMAAAGRMSRRQGELLGVVVLGLLVNAAVFGGLSAPVERYQSRVIWILPALLWLFLAERAASGAEAPARAAAARDAR